MRIIMNKKILVGINWLAAGLLTLVLLFAALIPHDFLNKEDWVQAPVLIVVTAGILVIINGVKKGVEMMTPKVYRRILIVLGILIALVQLWVALNFISIARADSYFVREQAIALAQGSHHWANYFKVYPNNVNTALFEATMLKPFIHLGILRPWAYLNIIRFIWIDTGLISGLYILKSWKKWRPAALFLMFTGLISIPVYSYGLFSYNDPLVMPMILNVLALGLASYHHNGVMRWMFAAISWILIAFAIVMKSNLVVLWIAVFLILMIATFSKKIDWKLAIKWLLGSVIAIILFFFLASTAAKSNGYVKDHNQAVPVTSWISMSLNPEKQGQYSGQDFRVIRDAKTAQEKKQLANQRIVDRVKELGAGGLIVHFAEKLGVFISHGDFDAINLDQQWIKAPDIFMEHQTFERFGALLVTQCWYLAMLVGAIWQLIKKRQHLLTIGLLSLFALGLTSFHVFFWEVEPRYSLPILPVIMLLGTLGWSNAPQFAFSTSKKLALTGLMAIGVMFSASSVIQTMATISTVPHSVSLQGIGNYFDPNHMEIKPYKRYDFNIPMRGHSSNRLELTSPSEGIVTVDVSDKNKLLTRVTDRAKFLKEIDYPTTDARDLRVSISNDGFEPVKYLGGKTNYSLVTGQIVKKPQMNLRWYVDKMPGAPMRTLGKFSPREVDYSHVVILNATLFMVAIVGVTWFKRRHVVAIFSKKNGK